MHHQVDEEATIVYTWDIYTAHGREKVYLRVEMCLIGKV